MIAYNSPNINTEGVFVSKGGKDASLQTYSGRRVSVMNPQAEQIDIGDIIISLAKQCRFNGHCQHFYSVAEHSVRGAEIAEKAYGLGAAKEFLLHDAVALVRTKELDELLAVAVALGINIQQKTIEIRRELLTEAKANPEAFIKMFDDPRVKCRSAVIQANDFQIISLRPDGVYWFDSGRMILSVPAGQDPTDIMVRFCLTEKGAPVYEELVSRLEKLS